MIIHFIRHCESVWNIDSRYSGHTDVPLSSRGMQQANHLAVKLKQSRTCQLFSSDLDRAKNTAIPIGKAMNIPVYTEQSLREVKFGAWEGLTQSEIIEKYPDLWMSYIKAPAYTKFPDGESGFESLEKSLGVISEILLSQKTSETIIVSHGTLIRIIISSALGLKLDNFRNVFEPLGNGSISSVRFPYIGSQENFFGSGTLLTYNLKLTSNTLI